MLLAIGAHTHFSWPLCVIESVWKRTPRWCKRPLVSTLQEPWRCPLLPPKYPALTIDLIPPRTTLQLLNNGTADSLNDLFDFYLQFYTQTYEPDY